MKQCEIVQENLSAFLYGELSAEENQAIHHHLGQCEQCLQEEMELRKTMRRVNQFHLLNLPDDFDAKLNRKLQKVTPAITHPKKMAKYRRVIWAIAATLVLTLGLEFLAYQFLFTSDTEVSLTQYQTKQALFEPVKGGRESVSEMQNKFVKKFSGRFSAGK